MVYVIIWVTLKFFDTDYVCIAFVPTISTISASSIFV